MSRFERFILYIILWILLFLFLPCCGTLTVKHKASGEVETKNTVEVTFPLCNRPEWTYEQIMQCIQYCMTMVVRYDGKLVDKNGNEVDWSKIIQDAREK